jgi:hypothetical protein
MKLKLTYLFIIILILSSISTCFTYAEETSPKLENKDISTLNTFNITLSKPEGFLYLFDIPVVSLPPMMPFDAIIIGSITITASSDNSELDHVEFYVDNELKTTVTESPYTWLWNAPLSPPPIHTVKVIGYLNDKSSSDQARVLFINPF